MIIIFIVFLYFIYLLGTKKIETHKKLSYFRTLAVILVSYFHLVVVGTNEICFLFLINTLED